MFGLVSESKFQQAVEVADYYAKEYVTAIETLEHKTKEYEAHDKVMHDTLQNRQNELDALQIAFDALTVKPAKKVKKDAVAK